MKILVADDSSTTLALLTNALQKLGHEVLAVIDGKAAIESYKKETPDLVILDVVMPEMDGFECARQIRKINPDDWIPIIFLSASVDDDSVASGIEAGGDDYLTKPVSEIKLEAKIKAMQRIAKMRKKLLLTTDELKTLSSTDTLTGLYNRFQFERSLIERIAAADRHHRNMSILFIDVDHFKSINDGFGHHVGDKLLKGIAGRLRLCTRADDIVARIGGDEFVIILSDIKSTDDVEITANKIIEDISEPYEIEGVTIRVSVSIGIAYYPENGITKDTIVTCADLAMYEAKSKGRNNYQIFTKDMQDRQMQYVSLEHELKFALDRNQLYIVYQPIFNMLTKKIMGMEALLRWNHTQFGELSPNVFIPIAEELGLINDIGRWVMLKVCEQGAKWIEEGVGEFKLSINLSVLQFMEEGFIEYLDQVIKDTNMDPHYLEIELTESTLITYTQKLKAIMMLLQKRGIGISIDDFGTRYSSITSLRYLPITTLKIDKSFIKDVCTDTRNSIIVKALIALGLNLNLTVIAEGIETEQQAEFAMINNCIYAQGFLYGEPFSVNKMSEYLRENHIKKTKVR